MCCASRLDFWLRSALLCCAVEASASGLTAKQKCVSHSWPPFPYDCCALHWIRRFFAVQSSVAKFRCSTGCVVCAVLMPKVCNCCVNRMQSHDSQRQVHTTYNTQSTRKQWVQSLDIFTGNSSHWLLEGMSGENRRSSAEIAYHFVIHEKRN